jgi:hypothetical protein
MSYNQCFYVNSELLKEKITGMKPVIYLTTYSFHGHQQFTNFCNWQCSKLCIACQINLNQITCNRFLFSFTIYIKTNRDILGFRMIFKVPLNQIFSNFNKMLYTIKYRLCLITVYFKFTVPELWPFLLFSMKAWMIPT